MMEPQFDTPEAQRHAVGKRRPFWMLPLGRVKPLWWAPITVVLVTIDRFVGPYVQLPTVYVLPVGLAAWYSGRNTALVLAVVLPASRLLLLFTLWNSPWPWQDSLLTAIMRAVTFVVLAMIVYRLVEHERALERDLQLLQGLLPICSHCKSIRNAQNQWESLETFIGHRSGAEFSHGMCPDCLRTHYPEFFAEKLRRG